MKRVLLILLAALAPACLGAGSGGVDLNRLASEVSLIRQDIVSIAPLASPELQEKLTELVQHVQSVEAALLAAASGGPLQDVYDYANAAVMVAKVLTADLPPGNDLRFAIVAAEIVLRRIAAGQMREATEAAEETVVAEGG